MLGAQRRFEPLDPTKHLFAVLRDLHPARQATGKAPLPIRCALTKACADVLAEKSQMPGVHRPQDLAATRRLQPEWQPEVSVASLPGWGRPPLRRHDRRGAAPAAVKRHPGDGVACTSAGPRQPSAASAASRSHVRDDRREGGAALLGLAMAVPAVTAHDACDGEEPATAQPLPSRFANDDGLARTPGTAHERRASIGPGAVMVTKPLW